MDIEKALAGLKRLHDLYEAMHLPGGTVAEDETPEREEVYSRVYGRYRPDSRAASRIAGPTHPFSLESALTTGLPANAPVPGPPLIAVDDRDYAGVGYDAEAVLAFLLAALNELPALYNHLYFYPEQMQLTPLSDDTLKRILFENELLRYNVRRLKAESEKLARTQFFEFFLRQSILKLFREMTDMQTPYVRRSILDATIRAALGSAYQPDASLPSTQEGADRIVEAIYSSMLQPFTPPQPDPETTP